jgi:CRP-like cAMP-binding protein
MAEATRTFSKNRLLDKLPDHERTALLSKMRCRPIVPHQMLQPPGQDVGQVYFPLTGVISLVTPLEDGSAIEVAAVGNEGMVGVHAFLGGGPLGNVQAMSQVPGEMLSMDAETFRAIADRDGELRGVMASYSQALFAQIAQAVACNGAHEVQQRTAKWLLEVHDRVGADEFQLTQEFLADMLGVTLFSVSAAAGILQTAGLIRCGRGRVMVLDREALEEASCECYAAACDEYERLLGPKPPRLRSPALHHLHSV